MDSNMLIARRREECYQDAVNLLMEYDECLIPRGTGFGKTGILMRIAHDYLKGYKRGILNQKVLYLYPHTSVLEQAENFWGIFKYNKDKFKGIRCMSYTAFLYMSRERMEKEFKRVNLILCDECHFLPAKQISKAFEMLRDGRQDAKVVGATATVLRMDGKDLVERFFKGHVVREYTLSDMIAEGVVKKPFYLYCTFDNEDSINKAVRRLQDEVKGLSFKETEKVKKHIRSEYARASAMVGVKRVFSDVLHNHAPNQRIITGIFFFKTIKHIYDRRKEIEEMVRAAYPNHKLNIVILHSQLKEKEKIEALEAVSCFGEEGDVCNIVLNVDMLSHGVHIPGLTFVAMYRETSSGLIYGQQFGRAIDSGSSVPSIIFDMVDNLHRPSLYKSDDRKQISEEDLALWERLNEKLINKGIYDLSDIESVLTAEEVSEYKRLSNLINTPIIIDKGGTRGGDKSSCDPWYYNVNTISEKDVNVLTSSASVREIMEKVDGYSLRAQAKRAHLMWIKHFKELNPEEYIRFIRLQDNNKVRYILDKAFPDKGVPPFLRYCACSSITLERALYCLYNYTMTKKDIQEYINRAKNLENSFMLCNGVEVASRGWMGRAQ